jgi:hypothetical protein
MDQLTYQVKRHYFTQLIHRYHHEQLGDDL